MEVDVVEDLVSQIPSGVEGRRIEAERRAEIRTAVAVDRQHVVTERCDASRQCARHRRLAGAAFACDAEFHDRQNTWARRSWYRRAVRNGELEPMCLGIPGKLVETYEKHGAHLGKVDFDGILKEVCLEYLPDLEIGAYTIVHVGFAITELDEKEALESLELMRSLGVLSEELDPEEAERIAAFQAGQEPD